MPPPTACAASAGQGSEAVGAGYLRVAPPWWLMVVAAHDESSDVHGIGQPDTNSGAPDSGAVYVYSGN